MTEARILIVEDEEKIATLLRDYLLNASFQVHWINHGQQALEHLRQQQEDLVLLDLMLPGMDGIEICREVRKFSEIPIIMVTAKTEEIDRLLGLEIGADDYICKPFSPREVVARVKAILRRTQHQTKSQDKIIRVADLCINLETYVVTVHDQTLKLTPSEFNLLKTLASHPERVFSRNDLLTHVFGYDFEGYDRTIDSHIKNLRKKLAHHWPDNDPIQAVYGLGYRFCVPPQE